LCFLLYSISTIQWHQYNLHIYTWYVFSIIMMKSHVLFAFVFTTYRQSLIEIRNSENEGAPRNSWTFREFWRFFRVFHRKYLLDSYSFWRKWVILGQNGRESFINDGQILGGRGSVAVWYFHTKKSKKFVFCVTSFMNGP